MRACLALLASWLLVLPSCAQTAPTPPPSETPQATSPAPQQTTPTPGSAVPQNPTSPIPGAPAPTAANTITRNVRLVVLDMVVIDSKGNAVTDLNRNDFHVTENDEPQDIRNFDPPGRYTVDPSANINSTADLDRIAPRAPVNIVLLDEFNTRFEDMAFARYSLEKWLKKQPDKLDTPTMLVSVSLQNFTVLHDYTQDKAAIISALDHHFVAYPWQVHQYAWIAERYATAFLALRRVAEATVGHFGHKNMIWIGRGFPTVNRSRFSVDDESRINSAVQQTVNELRDARVTLYTIDPAGVMIDPAVYGMANALFSPFGGDPDFEALSRATGGRSMHGRNDVDAQIGTSIRDGASIYTLTYRPTEANFNANKFRRIKVTVDRPGLTVVTRQGYFQERGPAHIGNQGEMSRRLATELLGAETSNMVYDAVPFTVQAAPDANTYKIHIEPRGLVWYYPKEPGGRRTTKLILLVTSFDKKGKEVAREGKTLTAQAPANAPSTGRIDVPIDIPYKLEAPPKAVRARFVVRVDATGRMGTADLTLGQAGAVAKSAATPPPPDAISPTPDSTQPAPADKNPPPQ